jgi:outer membrane protein
MIKKLLVSISAMLFSYAVFAADAAPKIAFIDGTAIMKKYEGTIESQIADEFKSEQAELDKLQKNLVAEGETYARDSAMMSDTEKLAFQQNFEKQQMELQKLGTAFNQKRMKRGNEELEKLLKKVEAVVKTVATKEQYNVVFQKGAALYADESYDITKEVLAELDKK